MFGRLAFVQDWDIVHCRMMATNLLILSVCAWPGLALADSLLEVTGWGDSLSSVRGALEDRCMAERSYRQEAPVFPLAGNLEQHYLCLGYRSDSGLVDKVAFVFADDALVQIEARGNAVNAFASIRSPPVLFMRYHIYDEGERLADLESDTVWYLSLAARQSSLFVWSSPVLDFNVVPNYERAAAIPDMLRFDEGLNQVLPHMRLACPYLQVQPSRRITLPNRPSVQTEATCVGLIYAGFPRRIDAMFGDGVLHSARIPTGKPEESRVRDALLSAFGSISWSNDHYDVFADGRVALRKDEPEVLLLSESIAPYFRAQLQ